MDPYLLGLRLEGRRVVVVGGGAVASRRIPALLDAGADVLLVSPKVAASLEDLAAAGRIRWEPRGYRPGDCAGAWLVCACTDDPEVNAAVAAAAEAQRTWYVRADDAGASAAWTPASGGPETPGRRAQCRPEAATRGTAPRSATRSWPACSPASSVPGTAAVTPPGSRSSAAGPATPG